VGIERALSILLRRALGGDSLCPHLAIAALNSDPRWFHPFPARR
jgi:hypothetical protein